MHFLFINDFNDINQAIIRHFSLDKGHYLAKAIQSLGHTVYFMTMNTKYEKNGINYVPITEISEDFLELFQYVIIVREPLFTSILEKIPSVKNYLAVPKIFRNGPKFIIKSDSILWIRNKELGQRLSEIYLTPIAGKEWMIHHIDYICAQNELYLKTGLKTGVPRQMMLLSSMSISNNSFDRELLIDPYLSDHSYCVTSGREMMEGKALLPLYYVNHPEERILFDRKKTILIYTGRIKTNKGRIFYDMRDIMDLLGEDFELHLFPGSFVIPTPDDKNLINRSGKDTNSLEMLRDQIFPDSRNIIIHFPYQHHDKYRYLNFADCGIDFSDVRPQNILGMAGHAKILEYCEMGLPVVCENNIQNLYLLVNGKNGIILPYRASANEYANAIREILSKPIDRAYCRAITMYNENWNRRAGEILDQLAAV
jgi:glycosyltransferase involved in cell wall biosynthesis